MSDSDSDYDIELDSINIDTKIGNEYDINLKCQCYSLPLFHEYDKFKKLENSDKILVPMFFLKSIEEKFKEIKFPLIFEIQNEGGEESVLKDIGLKNNIHCQVYEFIEGLDDIFIPFRMMQSLWLNEGEFVNLKYSVKIEYCKGTKILLRPHTSDFLEIEDHKTFLEKGLVENYSILSNNDIISLEYLGNVLYFDVLSTEPGECIIINDTDLEVDFEKPLDYKEPKPKTPPPSPTPIENQEENKILKNIKKNNNGIKDFEAFSGEGRRLGD
jgi:ubiquitin fusion degradation protein 1